MCQIWQHFKYGGEKSIFDFLNSKFSKRSPTFSKFLPLPVFSHSELLWFGLRLVTKAPRSHPSRRRGAEKNGKKQAETGGSA